MYQGTTPSVIGEIKGYDLTGSTVYVSFKQGNRDVLTKSGADVTVLYDGESDTSTVICALTQEETLEMKQGSTLVQIRFIYENGQAFATNKQPLKIESVLLQEVIAYIGGGGE